VPVGGPFFDLKLNTKDKRRERYAQMTACNGITIASSTTAVVSCNMKSSWGRGGWGGDLEGFITDVCCANATDSG